MKRILLYEGFVDKIINIFVDINKPYKVANAINKFIKKVTGLNYIVWQNSDYELSIVEIEVYNKPGDVFSNTLISIKDMELFSFIYIDYIMPGHIPNELQNVIEYIKNMLHVIGVPINSNIHVHPGVKYAEIDSFIKKLNKKDYNEFLLRQKEKKYNI